MAQIIALAETNMRTEHLTAFDLWLRGTLAHQFGQAEAEVLPEELLSLLPQDDDAHMA